MSWEDENFEDNIETEKTVSKYDEKVVSKETIKEKVIESAQARKNETEANPCKGLSEEEKLMQE